MSFVAPAAQAVGSFASSPKTMNFMTGLTDVLGALNSAKGQGQSAQIQANNFEYNAAILRQRAEQVRQGATIDIERQRRMARRHLGTQRAAYAAAGVKLEGSPLEVMVADAAELMLDQEITRYNSESQISAYETDARNAERQAEVIRKAGKTNVGSTLLSTIPRLMQRFGSIK